MSTAHFDDVEIVSSSCWISFITASSLNDASNNTPVSSCFKRSTSFSASRSASFWRISSRCLFSAMRRWLPLKNHKFLRRIAFRPSGVNSITGSWSIVKPNTVTMPWPTLLSHSGFTAIFIAVSSVQLFKFDLYFSMRVLTCLGSTVRSLNSPQVVPGRGLMTSNARCPNFASLNQPSITFTLYPKQSFASRPSPSPTSPSAPSSSLPPFFPLPLCQFGVACRVLQVSALVPSIFASWRAHRALRPRLEFVVVFVGFRLSFPLGRWLCSRRHVGSLMFLYMFLYVFLYRLLYKKK
jgi:hypothetical protein